MILLPKSQIDVVHDDRYAWVFSAVSCPDCYLMVDVAVTPDTCLMAYDDSSKIADVKLQADLNVIVDADAVFELIVVQQKAKNRIRRIEGHPLSFKVLSRAHQKCILETGNVHETFQESCSIASPAVSEQIGGDIKALIAPFYTFINYQYRIFLISPLYTTILTGLFLRALRK